MAAEYIFVYGSLRKGFSLPARNVLDEYAEYIGEATFQGKLYKIDWYPGAVSSDKPNEIVYGEVYKIIDKERILLILDRYEGCSPAAPKPHAFIRKQLPVILESGKEMTAWIYLYDLPTTGKERVLSGDYTKV